MHCTIPSANPNIAAVQAAITNRSDFRLMVNFSKCARGSQTERISGAIGETHEFAFAGETHIDRGQMAGRMPLST